MIKRNDSVFSDKIDQSEADEAARQLALDYGGRYCLIPAKVVAKLLAIVSGRTFDDVPSRDGFGLTFAKALKIAGHDDVEEVIAATRKIREGMGDD